MIGKLRFRLTLAALAALLVLGLALPAGASATEFFTFAATVSPAGDGFGEVECKFEEPGEEAYEEACPESPASYPKNTKITATPLAEEPESEFAGFPSGTGNATICPGKNASCSFTLTQNSTVSVRFDLIRLTLKVEAGGSGRGIVECEAEVEVALDCSAETGHPQEVEYPYGEPILLTAEAERPESEFVEWETVKGEGCVPAEEPECTFFLEEDTTVRAVFNLGPRLEIVKKGTGTGTVECEWFGEEPLGPCANRYPKGAEVVLYATPGPLTEFGGWEGCDSEAGEECELTMTGPRSVAATFESTAEYTLTIEATGPGTVTSSPGSIHCPSICSGSFRVGTKVTLTATPAAGSLFAGWAGGGCKGIGGCTVTVSGDMTVAGEFEPKPPPLPEVEEGPLEAGTARAAASAQVKAGKAALKLSCAGGPCDGTLQLAAKVKQGHKLKSLVAGRAPFHLAAGAKKTIEVKLSGPVKQELAKGKTVKVKLSGTGVASATITLEPAKTHKSH